MIVNPGVRELSVLWWVVIVNLTVPRVACVVPLKVHVQYVDTRLSPETREIISTAFSTIARLFILKNTDTKPVFHIPRQQSACGSSYSDGLNVGKCAVISRNYVGDFCEDVEIPLQHLQGLKVYEYESVEHLNESLPEGKGFDDGTNFVVYVTSRASRLCLHSKAHSLVCRMDMAMMGGVRSGRPLAGVVNLCEAKLNLNKILLRRIITHEVIHLLGFNYRSIQEFIGCYPEEEDEGVFPNCGIGERNDSELFGSNAGNNNILCWKQRDVLKIVKKNEVVLQSSHIELAALHMESYPSEEYDCMNRSSNESPSICFLELNTTDTRPVAYENISRIFEEYGGIVLAKTRTGIHWSSELFTNIVSVMVPGNLESGKVVIDPLTLALMKTSGWYNINLTLLSCINCFLNIESELEECFNPNGINTLYLPRIKVGIFDEEENSTWQKGNFSTKLNNMSESSYPDNSPQETIIQMEKQSSLNDFSKRKVFGCNHECLHSEGTKSYPLYILMAIVQMFIIFCFSKWDWHAIFGTVAFPHLPDLC